MHIFEKIIPLKTFLQDQRKRGSIGFVPTMGALHLGHISLIASAKQSCDFCVCSIFVNPTQFNDSSDFDKYPKTIESDLKQLESAGCNLVFMPTVEEMYPHPTTESFDFGLLDKVMEGAFRPGHFNGVAVVVKKLLEIVEPDIAFFGEKDFQQLAVIRRLVEMLDLPVQIVGCPIIRESDGLAMSSRNARLTKEERISAAKINEIILAAKNLAPSESLYNIKEFVKEKINSTPLLRLEYFEISDAITLESLKEWDAAKKAVACIAVFAGEIRLIDNIMI